MQKIEKEEGFIITTNTGVARGLFFRLPVQTLDLEYWIKGKRSLTRYTEVIKNPTRRIFEILIGNGSVIKNINKWEEEQDFGGVRIRTLCLPFYFKRNFRQLKAISTNKNSAIERIISYGYDDEFVYVSGECIKEKTKIIPRSGKIWNVVRKDTYQYTYRNMVKQILKAGAFELKK